MSIPDEVIMDKIFMIRRQKVMIDMDLAELYGVNTKALKQQVRRNIERFPEDFMFELSKKELENLRSQFVTSKWGGVRYPPMAFTEQGIAMLSSVLKSPRAIQVNIRVIRIFTRLRKMILTHKDLLLKMYALEKKCSTRIRMSNYFLNILNNSMKHKHTRLDRLDILKEIETDLNAQLSLTSTRSDENCNTPSAFRLATR